MKFKIIYEVGETVIEANTLEEAETIANQQNPDWLDIIMEDKTQGVEYVENLP